ncbi:mannose-1-phosphate guanylyltransferase/mannose-6-phosphate isomerase [Halopseudomonas phragmitis]|uniref:Alginate biosynthesis protein AlgA n=2 Tax=Pseudomonadaceae TaxID=135621 RepID=A0A1V0B2M9_9GAMM|nr:MULTISPECIES: mannose-1-phosphate guanylyltransferase/mannose-6-phosphate isomerase [Pseudomonadaceae]AQZ94188.1 mannose-1-phosphate guanylyltransferase/mannose-6-phosphate isomerase [Halopseudomonas phragmitis]RHW20700.1 mannose-1-phosphate guanylyltransferase/mannose-6-phosphate isomerase [Pseudomonas jilinensis]
MIPLILSGGNGTRLWPLSRKLFPKQFHALTGDHTLFQQTLLRLDLPGVESPLVVCNCEHQFIVEEQLDNIGMRAQQVLLEPFGRNTAPAVALAALQLVEQGRDELLLVLPADHLIANTQAFHQALERARLAAERGALVLFGVPARQPETGYGYIKAGGSGSGPVPGALAVERFVEKPDLATAQSYVEDGSYFWNSGMFLFRCSRYLEELQRHSPDIYDTCRLALERSRREGENVHIDREVFECCPDDSIDYAVMEKTSAACVVPLSAGWTDVGSWTALWEVQDKDARGNVALGDVLLQESSNNYVHATNKLVTLIGLDDLVVVETRDAVMIAHKDKAQQIKDVVNRLAADGRDEVHSHVQVFRPWGNYDSVDLGERFQVKRITVQPGARLSLQMHHHRAEHWVVVSGTAQVTCDDKTFLLTENQSTYIPVASVHRLANPGKIPLEIIEVQSGSYLGEDDIERLEDVYGRTAALAR